MKYSLKTIVYGFVFCVVVVTTSVAQTEKKPQQISGGILNGKAISLPKPVYPEDAQQAKVAGEVKVQVLIGETGKVISAKAISGVEHVSLRLAAETAALQSVFSPTSLSGQPVKVSGIILYNFVADQPNEEKLKMFGVSTFLTVARGFAIQPEKLREAFEGEDLLKEMAEEIKDIKFGFNDISSFEKLPVARRIESIDEALLSLRTKANESDQWQIDLGKSLGRLIGPMMLLMMSGGSPDDLVKLDQSELVKEMKAIKQLTTTSPKDFPQDVLSKLKAFSALGDVDGFLSTKERREEFGSKILELIETISPGT